MQTGRQNFKGRTAKGKEVMVYFSHAVRVEKELGNDLK